MKKTILRNSEGYADPTAGRAIINIEGDIMDYLAGDIIKINRYNGGDKYFAVLGATQQLLTGITLRDVQFPGAVLIPCEGERYAMPERLEHLYCNTLTDEILVRTMTPVEIKTLKDSVAQYLGITAVAEEKPLSAPVDIQKFQPVAVLPKQDMVSTDDLKRVQTELAKAETKAEVYKELYMTLLEKTLRTA